MVKDPICLAIILSVKIGDFNGERFNDCNQEMEETGERCELAEQTLAKFRARGRGASVVRGSSPVSKWIVIIIALYFYPAEPTK